MKRTIDQSNILSFEILMYRMIQRAIQTLYRSNYTQSVASGVTVIVTLLILPHSFIFCETLTIIIIVTA